MKIIVIAFFFLFSPLFVIAGNPGDVRLLYWNIQNGMWSDQANNYDNFVNFVKEQNPDICVWCEAASIYYSGTADHLKTRDEAFLPANWDSLAERYGHKYVYLGGWRDDYPQVITSRYPVRNVKRILGSPDDVVVTHGAAWAAIEINGRTLNMVTLHMWPMPYEYKTPDCDSSRAENGGDKYRAREMKYICDETVGSVEDAKDQLWMMVGDFNSISRIDAPAYDIPEESTRWFVHDYIRENTPYIDVIAEWYNGRHVSSTAGNSRIDFIYATPPMFSCISNVMIMEKEGWQSPVRDSRDLSNFYHPSDHLPILLDFNLPD